MNWKYNDDRKRIIIEPPKQTLRITGHRIATVLGLDKYNTPFSAWAEITKLIKKPFEDNMYLQLGRVVEPKVIDYIRNKFPNIKSMEEYYGPLIDEYRYNNFKDESKIFGGMFDFVSTKNDGKTIALIGEIKTSGHAEYFRNGNIPTEYLLQAALYARLKNLDTVLFVVSLVDKLDYANPEKFIPNETNTILIVKKLNECFFEVDGEYLNIDGCMKKAEEWWETHIVSGISPEFDEVKDKEYLDILRKSKPANDNTLESICEEAIKLAVTIEKVKVSSGLDAMEKELEVLKKSIKETMITKDVDHCGRYTLKRNIKKAFDEKSFAEREPKLYDKYTTDKITYTLNQDLKEELKNV